MAEMSVDSIILGRISGVYGLQGWVKVFSYTEPRENILHFKHWQLNHKRFGERLIQLVDGRRQGKYIVARLEGIDHIDEANQWVDAEISVDKSQMPKPETGEYYWFQLENMQVITEDNQLLGQVDYVLATGANDVLVVKETFDSIDERERLIPFLSTVILSVDFATQTIKVNWDIDL